MARRKRRPLVPESRAALDQLKNQVMANQGYHVDNENPDVVKYEIAEEAGVPLKPGYNGRLTSKQAGTVGGKIGGSMVKELIRMAQERMKER
ncbi:alpha/beta-type small acid-soluble spore protein [Cytobacillus oceanisediminis]|uniref:alpha/beta-type small acid-soluble spore protein n=1 Tax=Cytobacillus oceanisediminis TaxID=665099 RepID=UPI001C21FA16|nr:alpha/beta-type small acid-soluble spore protein [Cytobacillus oceanisediminis]MBU8770884.1 alpha/beta-type small acid-soluble spore protein [Cytobacillus oceanisediminis]USK43886.1 alpha/beta-type small acid-soluble spore protein [Cytobacillus oceanisediminis]